MDPTALERWGRAGMPELTGHPDGPALVPPPGLPERVAALGDAAGIDPFPELSVRVRLLGLRRCGRVSAGGAARLVRAGDGWLAVSLPRSDDVASIAAWLECDPVPDGADHWPLVEESVGSRPTGELVERATLLGLPVSIVGEAPPACGAGVFDGLPLAATDHGPAEPLTRAPVVVDLSSLWAGPLCARILLDQGARVVKVESARRPDGARRGPRHFFERMNSGKEERAFDPTTQSGRAELRSLLLSADVVVESSRARALAQLGIDAREVLATGPRVWVSITGHGRPSDRVSFGDDAAAAGGLVAWTRDPDDPCFVGDAIADPLTGITAAAAVRRALSGGATRRWMLDVPMAGVAAYVAAGALGTAWVAM